MPNNPSNTLTQDRNNNMPWRYKTDAYHNPGRKIKEGKEWQDDEGVQHPWCWARWDDEYKATMGLRWYEDYKP